MDSQKVVEQDKEDPISENESNVSSELKKTEQEIDQGVFHLISKKKQKRFKRTVFAVHAIVTQKLYKSKASSLESYFKTSWNISRAQVYRFLDSAWVLQQLEGFPEPPTKERFCRCLKKLAKNRNDIWILWKTVLEKTQYDHEAITSNVIQEVWNDLFMQGKVSGIEDTADLGPRNTSMVADEEIEKSPADPMNDAQNLSGPTILKNENSISISSSDLSSDDSIYDKLEEVGASHGIIESIIPNYEKKIATRPKKKKPDTTSVPSPEVFYRPISSATSMVPSHPREQPQDSMLSFPSYGLPSIPNPSIQQTLYYNPQHSQPQHQPHPQHSHPQHQPHPQQQQHSYPLPNWKWTTPHETCNHPHLNQEDISQFTKTLVTLQRQGYLLQPFSNTFGKWIDEPLLYWRFYNAREPGLSLPLTQQAGPIYSPRPMASYHLPQAHSFEPHWNPLGYSHAYSSHGPPPVPSTNPYPPNHVFDPSSSHNRMIQHNASSSSSTSFTHSQQHRPTITLPRPTPWNSSSQQNTAKHLFSPLDNMHKKRKSNPE